MTTGIARFVVMAGAWLLATACGGGPAPASAPAAEARSPVQTGQSPQFTVDPSWPKPFPLVTDAAGNSHRWVTGEIGGTCSDSYDHVFTLNRGWQQSGLGKLQTFEGMSGIPAPPVVVYDPEDRGNARVAVFDRTGVPQREIPINPAGFTNQPLRTNDISFSTDDAQGFFYTSDVGSSSVWIVNRSKGGIVGGFGSVGHHAGQFVGVHTMAVDSMGNLYVSEGGGGRRTQKFVRQ